jgi:ribonuclease P protein component
VSLRTGRDFSRVYRTGRRARIDGVTVWAAPVAPATPSRLGLTVPAAAGTAVARNRLRRRLRAIFRSAGPADGYEVVIRGDAEAAGRNFQELTDVVRGALARAGIGSRP